MKSPRSLFFGFATFILGAVGPTLSFGADKAVDAVIDIPYKRLVLTNGLTLIVHEDHKAPIVAVNLWYHVGSKNEVPGKTGFAHLFEHLMFTGSENFRGSGNQRAFFEEMEKIGATDMNGTTSNDRTDYFENVPKNALDIALWLESDRMGHLLGAIDKTKLDTQRGVVQNEKRQYENEPYGISEELITKGTAPAGHPYSWTVIGSMEDLDAASLEDVRTWFKTYYGPANSVLVLAGDIDPETALRKAEQYFGDIPSGPPIAKFERWLPVVKGTRRQTATDRVPQARLTKVWNVSAYGERENVYLDLVAGVLARGKTSRFYKRLVYDEQIATDVSVDLDSRELSSQFAIVANARPGESLEKVERSIDEELARFLKEEPSEKELDRVKAQRIAGFVRGAERIGGFGGKSDILAMNQTFRGDPGFYKTVLQYYREATTADLLAAARKWLNDDVYILEIHPFPEFATAGVQVDRSKLPTPGEPPDVKFPTLQRTALPNGLKVVLAERHAVPLVNFSLQVDAGFASDQFATPGTARLAMDMLDEGTAKRTALQISEELALLGASVGAGSDLDTSGVSLSALKSTLDEALNVYADVILSPAFPETDLERLRKQLLAAIQQEKAQPFSMALRVLPRLLYGAGHAYANPGTGSGTEESVTKLTRADVQKFHQTWFKPNNATLIVVGDITMSELAPKLEKLFADWKAGEVPKKNIGQREQAPKPVIYLVDRPGSIQSVVIAGNLAPPKANPDEIAIETVNVLLGGSFSSRVNLNIREDKHWAYGAGTFVWPARGPRAFLGYAPVQLDKTSEAMVELEKELRGILGRQPITEEELVKAQKNQTLELPGRWETISAVGGSVGEIVRFGLPDDYFATYADKVRALTVKDLERAAEKAVHPDNLVWVVIGDREKIESKIRDLGWGEILRLDTDGNLAAL
jgi:zinc protease